MKHYNQRQIQIADILHGIVKTVFIIGMMCYFISCNTIERKTNYPPHTYETDDTSFCNGEILLPDYVHLDTLIVTDAKVINWAMEYYDAASDGDIADILRTGTKKYTPLIHSSITKK